MDLAGSDDIPVKAGWSDACLQCTSNVSMSWDDKSKVNKTQSDDRARQNRTIPTSCALSHSNNYTIGTTQNPAQLLGRARMRLRTFTCHTSSPDCTDQKRSSVRHI